MVCIHECHSEHLEVRGQLLGAGSLLLKCGAGDQVKVVSLAKASLPAKPSLIALKPFMKQIHFIYIVKGFFLL